MKRLRITNTITLLAAIYLLAGYASGCDPLSFLSGRRVYLVDFLGEVQPSRERTDHAGVRWAYARPFTKTGHVLLLADGKTGGESSYFDSWSYDRPAIEAKDTIEAKNQRYLRRLDK